MSTGATALALHGLEHVPPCGMDDEHFRRATLAGKQQLETAFHTQVSGYRAPCFGLDEEKLDIVRQLGFPLRFEPDGLPAARHVKHLDMTSYLLRPGIYRKGEFYEFSLSCQRLFGQNYPISGGGYVRLSNAGALSCRSCAAICANRITMCSTCIRLSFRGSISRSLRD